MPLTTLQQATLKAAILANPALQNEQQYPHNPDGAVEVANYLNALESPAYTVWRSSVTVDEIMSNGFDWVLVDNLSAGKARIWEWMTQLGVMNPSKANVRAGISECWKGTAPMVAQANAILAHCYRSATRLEKLFASGAGTVAAPSTMTVEGAIGGAEVNTIMGW